MSKLDRLIAEFCSDGVEFVKLEDVADIGTGSNNTVDGRNDGQYPFFVRSQEVRYMDTYEFDETAIITSGDGVGVGKIFHYVEGKYALHQRAYRIHICDDRLFPKFFFCYMTAKFFDYISMNAFHASVTSIRRPMLNNFPVPLPSLAIQSEIVRILDNFTELTAELTARKKQYEYYRNQLLIFGDDVPMVALGEIGTITRGNGLQKSNFIESGIGCIHYGQIYTYYDTFAYKTKSFVSSKLATQLRKINTGDIIIAVTSENVEDVCKCVAWLGEDEIVTGGHTAILKHNQNPKYIAYYLQTAAFFEQKRKIAYGTKVIEVTPKKLERLKVPLPQLSEQARIVAVLDKFDALTTSITNGLPAEIEARRKQYEYYRDKLLTFKEMDA